MRMTLGDLAHDTAYQQTEVHIVKGPIPAAIGALLPSMPHKAATHGWSPWATHGVHTVVDFELAVVPKVGAEAGSFEADRKYTNTTLDDSIIAVTEEKPIARARSVTLLHPGPPKIVVGLAKGKLRGPVAELAALHANEEDKKTFCGRGLLHSHGIEHEHLTIDDRADTEPQSPGRRLAAGVSINIERVMKIEVESSDEISR